MIVQGVRGFLQFTQFETMLFLHFGIERKSLREAIKTTCFMDEI